MYIQLVHKLLRCLSVIAGISHKPSHNGVILLLNKTVVVLSGTPGPGKSYMFISTESHQVVIDKLTAVI